MKILSTKKKGTFETDDAGKRLLQLIDSMQWDYDRMSSSGQETYDEICDYISEIKK